MSLDQLLEQDLPVLEVKEDRTSVDPRLATLQDEIWNTVREIIARDLTENQRQALIAVVFDDVPLDQIAELLHAE